MVRYLTYLINDFRPADDPFTFTKAQFWAVYSGAAGGWQCGRHRAQGACLGCMGNPGAAAAWRLHIQRPAHVTHRCILRAARPLSIPPAGFILLHGVFNAISVKLLGFLSIVSVVFHVAGTLAIVIGAPRGRGVAGRPRHALATPCPGRRPLLQPCADDSPTPWLGAAHACRLASDRAPHAAASRPPARRPARHRQGPPACLVGVWAL